MTCYLTNLPTAGKGRLSLQGDPASGSISITEKMPGDERPFEVIMTHHAAKRLYEALGRAIADAEIGMRYPEKGAYPPRV